MVHPVICASQVHYDGVDYNLRVLELQPAAAVSVIETDIAADVGPSIETEGYLRAQAEAQAREAERQRQAQEQAERAAAEVRWTRGRGAEGNTVSPWLQGRLEVVSNATERGGRLFFLLNTMIS